MLGIDGEWESEISVLSMGLDADADDVDIHVCLYNKIAGKIFHLNLFLFMKK